MYIPEVKPKRIKGFVQVPDITATILDPVKAKYNVRIDGKSMLPLIEKKTENKEFCMSVPPQLYMVLPVARR